MGVNLIKEGIKMTNTDRVCVILMIALFSLFSGYVSYGAAVKKSCEMIDSESRYIDGECVKVVKHD